MSGRSVAAEPTLRLLPFALGRPDENLALDAALLELPGPATLRLYGWNPAGLSLGRFQRSSRFLPIDGEHQIVRRQTGGGAIYHQDEITFALVRDASPDWTIEAAYVRVHDALVRALATVGVQAHRLGLDAPISHGARSLRHAWCFEHPTQNDIVTADGRKLCGSAQRRTRRPAPRVLHHGSLVVRRPAATPFCAALEDQADVDAIRAPLCSAIADEIATEIGASIEPGDWSPAECALAMSLRPSFAIELPTTDPATR